MADGLTSLLPIKWGQSTGGSPGEGESTLTLGVNRQDVRTPPDTFHVWHAQTAAIENVVLKMTADFKGGTRLLVREQTANPFGAGESGVYLDTSGTAYTVHNGTPSVIGGGGGTGTVTSVATGTGLTGGPITTTGTIAIDSTVATLTGSQTLTNKTLTAPVINGATSSGSTALNFSGNSGTFQTSTGAVTLNGDTTVVSGKTLNETYNAIGTAQTIGTKLQNTTAATSGVPQQYSPMLDLVGEAWNTTSVATKTQSWGLQLRSNNGANTNGSLALLSSTDGGAFGEKFSFEWAPAANFLTFRGNHTDWLLINNNNNGIYAASTSISVRVSGSSYFTFDTTALIPAIAGVKSGTAANPWDTTTSKRIAHNTQNIAFSATPAFDATAGNIIHFGPVTANVTGPTMAAGVAGERCTIVFLKDATAGTFTIAGWGSNTRTAGTLTFTSGASSLVTVSFVWDDRLGTPAWVETSRTAFN